MLTIKKRVSLVDWLVDDDVSNMSQDPEQLILILMDGFSGYTNQRDEDLVNEYYARCEPLNLGDPLNLKL